MKHTKNKRCDENLPAMLQKQSPKGYQTPPGYPGHASDCIYPAIYLSLTGFGKFNWFVMRHSEIIPTLELNAYLGKKLRNGLWSSIDKIK